MEKVDLYSERMECLGHIIDNLLRPAPQTLTRAIGPIPRTQSLRCSWYISVILSVSRFMIKSKIYICIYCSILSW
jgi:hypothetical protein